MNAREGQVFEGLPVKSVSIEALLMQREAILERIANAAAQLAEASALFSDGGLAVSEYRKLSWVVGGDDYYRGNPLLENVEPMRKRLDAAAWQYLMSESGMRTLMDHKARQEWDEKIHKADVPELTAENIKATFGMMHESRGDIFERGVINVFRGLSWCYKTNLPQKFGKRIVMYLGSSYSSYSRREQLDDMNRIFHVIDGKPEPDFRSGLYSQYCNARRGENGRELMRGELDADYVSIRWFKNGNAHVTFKRPDLVNAMNKILAKHYPGALPAPK